MWETWVRSLGWEDSLEKEVATHSSILAWKISWTEEPGGLQSMGSQRVRHDWATNTYFLTHHLRGFPAGSVVKESACHAGDLCSTPESGRSPWRREWLLTPVFLPGKSCEQRNLVGCSPWGRKRIQHNGATKQQFILNTSCLSDTYLTSVFSQSVACLFIF